jgi:tripartite-type tricarboxylate transporter receptor subunit TctC
MYGWNSKILLVVAPLCAAPLGAAAQSDFYKGKSLNVYIGFAPGGSYDFYGRLVARHIGKHLQGSPVVIPNSMPGAGSLRAANYLYTVAPKDGTAIGIVTQTLPLEVALGNTAAKYNANEFAWIGRATDVSDVAIAWHTAKAKTWTDLRSIDTTMANTGPGSTTYGFPKLLNALGATKFVLVRGYPGSTQAMLAMEQGETDSASTSWNTLRTAKASWVRDKQVNVLVMYTRSRIRDLPDVPAAPELGVDENAKKILAFYASSADVGRSFIAPPGLPAERIAELRDAFSKTMNDPEYLAEINKTRADHEPLSGAEIQRIVAEIADFPQELVNRMQEILNAPK